MGYFQTKQAENTHNVDTEQLSYMNGIIACALKFNLSSLKKINKNKKQRHSILDH